MFQCCCVFLLSLALPASLFGKDPMVPVFDAHCDVLYRMNERPFDLADPPDYISGSIPAMEKGGVTAQVFALWTNNKTHPDLDGAKNVIDMIGLFREQERKHKDRISHVSDTTEMDAVRESGRIPIFLFIEGGGPIAQSLEMMNLYHKLGVRGMTLTWMSNLEWAGASTDNENPNMGLTDFGKEVVREMNRLNWVIDLSHVSDQTFYDTVEITTDPVIVSHSACRALYDHPRNIDDDMLRALKRNGGVLCLIGYPGYLDPEADAAWEKAEAEKKADIDAVLARFDGNKSNPDYRHERRVIIQEAITQGKRTTIDDYVDHIEHAISVAGPEHVALGSDFDGIWSNVEGLANSGDWQNVARAMKRRGFESETIEAVMHKNLERVFRAVME